MLGTGGILAIVGIVLIVVGLIVGRRAPRPTRCSVPASPAGPGHRRDPDRHVPQRAAAGRPAAAWSACPASAVRGAHTEVVPLICSGRAHLRRAACRARRPERLQQDRRSTGARPASRRVFRWAACRWPRHSRWPGSHGRACRWPAWPPRSRSAASGRRPPQAWTRASARSRRRWPARPPRAAAPFATADQGNYTVEQLRAYLRQSGLQARHASTRLEDIGQDRRRRASVHDGDDAQHPRPGAPEAARVGGDGAGRGHRTSSSRA